MAKMTQTRKLYEMLKNGTEVPVQKIADELRINYYSVSVYIHDMKSSFKADIKSVRDGRKVVAYQLLNADKIKVPEFRKNSFGVAPKVKNNPLASLADELESANTGTVSEKEYADIRSSLGLDDIGGNTNGDY